MNKHAPATHQGWFSSFLFRNLIITFCALSGFLAAHECVQAATIHVRGGESLQAALNAARPGDTIILRAGDTFTGAFVLPKKAGDAWITIQSSALADLPAAGQRVSPANKSKMPKIASPGRNQPALRTEEGAHHYRIIGVEFLPVDDSALVGSLIVLGSASQRTLQQVPHHLVFDRCYVHAWPKQGVKRGFALNSAHTEIINSHVSDFKLVGFDSQAIAGWNGPGPFKIVNNYLSGAAEVILFGGADSTSEDMIPSNIEILRNHLHKPAAWRGVWTGKNGIELKCARRVLIEGNRIEGIYRNAQAGNAFVVSTRNQDGRAPWSVIQDVIIRNNFIKGAGGGLSTLGRNYNHPSGVTTNVQLINNLFLDLGDPYADGGRSVFFMNNGSQQVKIIHNTVVQKDQIMILLGDPSPGSEIRDNIWKHNAYGIWGESGGTGGGALQRYFPGSLFAGNVISGVQNTKLPYPHGNHTPSSLSEIGFVNAAADNYRLRANSPYKNKATDGKDVGCDLDALDEALHATTSPSSGGEEEKVGSTSVGRTAVLYPAKAVVRVGNWQVVRDAQAAGGAALLNGNDHRSKIKTPSADPDDYFEMSFFAEAGRPYRLWFRGKAEENSWSNDSAYAQFSGATNRSGKAIYQIGTTSATTLVLQDYSNATLSGWGWQDNGWGGELGSEIYFRTTGVQTIRIQAREDGLAIDQIVLSPDTFLSAPPGRLIDDATILRPLSGQ